MGSDGPNSKELVPLDNAPPPYCRADLSTPLSPQDALVRQLISFPPRGTVLDAPMAFGECVIVPLLTVASLTQIGNELNNCIGSQGFATECARGRAHFFAIQDQTGTTLGALHIHFPVNRNGVFDVSIDDCKGPHNVHLCEEGWNAVKAFCTWLKNDAPQRRIAALRPRAAIRKEWIGLPESLEMEITIAALGRLRQKSMRFDVLRNKVAAMMSLPQ